MSKVQRSARRQTRMTVIVVMGDSIFGTGLMAVTKAGHRAGSEIDTIGYSG